MAEESLDLDVDISELVDYLRITGEIASTLPEVVARKVTAYAARKSGLDVTDEELQKAADAFRIEKGMNKASDTESWLKDNGISIEVLEEHMETNVLISKFQDELLRKASKGEIIALPEAKEGVRDAIYLDWLNTELKRLTGR